MVPLTGSAMHQQRGNYSCISKSSKGKNTIRKTICLSLCFLFLSISTYVSVFLPLPSSNNSGIKLHYSPLYWSFGPIQDCLFCLPKEKCLMTYGVLIKSFLFGQIVLTTFPLNSIITHSGTFNYFQSCSCF